MTEQPILSVSELSLSLKGVVEQVFADVRVRGEVSGVKRGASGHVYFSLKDADAVLNAICWRGRDSTHIQEGLEVVCRGKLSTYAGRSNYQIIVETTEPAGVGALLKLLNERREKLQKEGLFDAAHKKKIPYLPAVIGVITSPTGAVIRDIMHRLNDRFPSRVILWPVAVQGADAAGQIARAVAGFNALPPSVAPRPDVIIVARGGGSLEDLWCFNEEAVVRAVYASDIPIISAVGHETDTTLIDYAADLRAPTPTGAAEKAVPVRLELMARLDALHARQSQAVFRLVSENTMKIKMLTKSLPNLSDILTNVFQRLDEQAARLENAFRFFVERGRARFESLQNLLHSYSYQSVLKRGFALVTHYSHAVDSARAASAYTQMTIHWHDGKESVRRIKNKNKELDEDIQQEGLFDVVE